MQSTILLIVLLTAFYIYALSQPVAPNQGDRADSLMSEGNIPEVLAEYERLYGQNPEDARIVYNYACVLSIDNTVINKFDTCFKYLNLAVELDRSVNALLEPDLLPARENKNLSVFENRLISMLNEKYNNPYNDIDYAKALWKPGALGQANFDEIGIAFRKSGMRSSVASAIWKLKFMIQ
jgi:hypothetical protein